MVERSKMCAWNFMDEYVYLYIYIRVLSLVVNFEKGNKGGFVCFRRPFRTTTPMGTINTSHSWL